MYKKFYAWGKKVTLIIKINDINEKAHTDVIWDVCVRHSLNV